MSALPELETDRLRLRQWRDDDLEAYAAVCADPDVMRWLNGPMSHDASAEQLDAFRQHWVDEGFGLWCTTTKGSDECIGFIGLAVPRFLPEVLPAVEIGWRLARPSWGKGLATEGARATVDFAFGPLGLDRIVSITIPENRSSWNVMEKLGMTLERTAKHPKRGIDVLVYELSAP
ncbi:MAG: GNAT family N-acetyltransferase [Acidimicrobiia bacterium]